MSFSIYRVRTHFPAGRLHVIISYSNTGGVVVGGRLGRTTPPSTGLMRTHHTPGGYQPHAKDLLIYLVSYTKVGLFISLSVGVWLNLQIESTLIQQINVDPTLIQHRPSPRVHVQGVPTCVCVCVCVCVQASTFKVLALAAPGQVILNFYLPKYKIYLPNINTNNA